MEKSVKPENLYIRRNRILPAIAATVFTAFAVTCLVLGPIALVKHPPEPDIRIYLWICFAVLGLATLYIAILNIRNLFFPYLLTADEKGIYNYSGLFHFGFIAWEDISTFGADATILDFLASDMPCIRAYLHDLQAYKRKLSFVKKFRLFSSGSNIKIYMLCSQIKRKQLLPLLNDMLKYYAHPEVQVENGE